MAVVHTPIHQPHPNLALMMVVVVVVALAARRREVTGLQLAVPRGVDDHRQRRQLTGTGIGTGMGTEVAACQGPVISLVTVVTVVTCDSVHSKRHTAAAATTTGSATVAVVLVLVLEQVGVQALARARQQAMVQVDHGPGHQRADAGATVGHSVAASKAATELVRWQETATETGTASAIVTGLVRHIVTAKESVRETAMVVTATATVSVSVSVTGATTVGDRTGVVVRIVGPTGGVVAVLAAGDVAEGRVTAGLGEGGRQARAHRVATLILTTRMTRLARTLEGLATLSPRVVSAAAVVAASAAFGVWVHVSR